MVVLHNHELKVLITKQIKQKLYDLSPGGGKIRLASNFSPLENIFPLHILVCVPCDFFDAAELIQLHGKRHGADLPFFLVQGGHNEHR